MKVGVVGGGITGLAVTHYLAERGVDVVTFEADAEPGGVIHSRNVGGLLVEDGPQRIRLTPSVAALVDELEIRDEVIEADADLPLYVYADGGLREVPRSISSFLRTDLLSWRGKLRVLAEPLTEPGSGDEQAAALFRRKFGQETYRNVIEPLFGGMYGSNPAAMPAKYSLGRLLELETNSGSLLRVAARRLLDDEATPPPVSFRDGLQTLPEAIYEKHHPYVHLNTPVEGIAKNRGGDRYCLDLGNREATVDVLVITVPGAGAATLLDDIDGATAEPLRDLTYNSLVLVHLHSDTDAEGFGYQVRRDEPIKTRGVTWNDSLFDRDGVYTAFLGGMDDPTVVNESDAELGSIASEEFGEVMGVEPDVISVRKLPEVLPAYDDSWRALDDATLPDDIVLATNYESRIGIPGRIRRAKQVAKQLAEHD